MNNLKANESDFPRLLLLKIVKPGKMRELFILHMIIFKVSK